MTIKEIGTATHGPILTGRVEELIDRLARLSEPHAGPGVTRLAYSQLERDAHRVFEDHMASLGLVVWTDAAGNTIAELPGEAGLPAIGTGSHLDSVHNGGAYDGAAGVVAAMLAATLLKEGAPLRHPTRFVAFAAEEGARFGQACTGSRIVAGMTVSADLDSIVDEDGISIARAMNDVGIDPVQVGAARWAPRDWGAFVELHIEQGSVLTDSNADIGIVNVISGSTRLALDLHGRASHTGGTPMHLRADALAAAAEIVLYAEELARDARHHGTRITVGKIDIEPGYITTIPGHCRVYIDIRDIDDARQRESAAELITAAEQLASSRGVGIEAQLLADASPAMLPLSVQRVLVAAASEVGTDYRVLPSGASHDTQMISHVCPSGMIFVPSRNGGVSHAPDEFTLSSDLARGIEVLVAGLRALDRTLSKA